MREPEEDPLQTEEAGDCLWASEVARGPVTIQVGMAIAPLQSTALAGCGMDRQYLELKVSPVLWILPFGLLGS